jgi:ABC-2 type transport system permease protein
MSSTQGFHAVMMLFLNPMWFLSGALFPLDGAWSGLKWVMRANPLTYGLGALRQSLQHSTASQGFTINVLVTLVFAVAIFLLAGIVARKTIAADLQ